MNFNLKTLTPIWTGGTDPKKMDRLQETGMIGSLRWWYEAILRGAVGNGTREFQLCNPTGESNKRCNYETNKRICLACDLFGATGWKRRFRLGVGGGESLFTQARELRVKAPSGNNGWFFSSPYISTSTKSIEGQVTVLRDSHQYKGSKRSPQVLNDLKVITALINRWGGLSAKTQHGFGVVDWQFEDNAPPDVESFLRNLPDDSSDDDGLPSLSNMFFAKLHFKTGTKDDWWETAKLDEGADFKGQKYRGIRDKGDEWRFAAKKPYWSVPIAPAVKYKLRYGSSPLFEAKKCDKYFFGDVKSDPSQKAKLNISNAYKNADGQWEFRLWGWFPVQNAPNAVKRNQLIAELHELVTDSPKHQSFWDSIFGVGVIDLGKSEWRERDASGHNRNTKDATGNAVSPKTSAAFLKCLLS